MINYELPQSHYTSDPNQPSQFDDSTSAPYQPSLSANNSFDSPELSSTRHPIDPLSVPTDSEQSPTHEPHDPYPPSLPIAPDPGQHPSTASTPTDTIFEQRETQEHLFPRQIQLYATLVLNYIVGKDIP
jgi:hypothetical protein